MTFDLVLRELLENHGITQKKLAHKLNLNPSTLGNYVRGLRQPDFDTLTMFADYFHVSTDYLLGHYNKTLRSHEEEKLLQVYRKLTEEEQKLFWEQGKLLVRLRQKRERAAS